jgi:acyl-CoA reductase-like NAD-dependent aldehyde dehydrogenase
VPKKTSLPGSFFNASETMNGTKNTRVEFEKFHNIVDGLPRSSSDFHHGINPSDGKALWDVPIATENDLDDAVKAAKKAFKTWSKTKWEDRQQIIKNIAEEFMKYEAEMGKLVMLEGGKPVRCSTSWEMVRNT